MSKTLRYRLFKVGAMPPAIRDRVSREQVLFFDEGVPVTIRRSGTAPGFRGGATGKFSGAFAISGRHIVATVSKTTMVDADFDAQYAGEKPASLSIKKDGLHVHVDAGINSKCTGEIDMHFKAELSEAQLDQLPLREAKFSFAPELVPKIFGVPG
jgi:hypothetical protein